MTKVIQESGVEFYMDERLRKNLEKVKKRVRLKDFDHFFCVDGEEGAGKSVFTMQLAKFLDPTFCLARVVFSAEDFRTAILGASKGQAVVFDEAFRGMSSRAVLTDVNKLLVELMMECRQKNLFIIVVMPSFFMLDKYAALHRSKGLFHIYMRKGQRGYWRFYNKKKKIILYMKGKLTYSYKLPKTNFFGRFTDKYVIDEEEYRKKKAKALQSAGTTTKAEAGVEVRNVLLYLMNREHHITTTDIVRRLKELGYPIGQTTVTEGIGKVEKKLEKEGKI